MAQSQTKSSTTKTTKTTKQTKTAKIGKNGQAHVVKNNSKKEQTEEQVQEQVQEQGQEQVVQEVKVTKKTARTKTPKEPKQEVKQEVNQETKGEETEQQGKKTFEQIYNELCELRKSMAELQKQEKVLLKKLDNYHKSEMKKVSSKKRKPNPTPIGFAVKKEVNGKLADWLHVPRGSQLSGPEISKAFWARLDEEGLKYNDDKRIFRTNKEVSEIFGVPLSVNESTSHTDEKGFNMRTHQTYIRYALTNNNSAEPVAEQEPAKGQAKKQKAK